MLIFFPCMRMFCEKAKCCQYQGLRIPSVWLWQEMLECHREGREKHIQCRKFSWYLTLNPFPPRFPAHDDILTLDSLVWLLLFGFWVSVSLMCFSSSSLCGILAEVLQIFYCLICVSGREYTPKCRGQLAESCSGVDEDELMEIFPSGAILPNSWEVLWS